MMHKVAKKKKVLITSSSYLPNIGGIENSIYYLAKAGEDDHVTIVTSDYINNEGDRSDRSQLNCRILRYALPKNRGKLSRVILGWKNAFSIYKDMKREKHDVVISRYHLNTVLCYLAGLRNIQYVVPGVVKYQDNKINVDRYSNSIYRELSYYYNRFVQYLAFRFSDKVFVFSQNMLQQVKSIDSKCNVVITAPGIDKEKFYLSDNKGDRTINLLVLSRLNSAKNIEMAINSLLYLPKEYRLTVVGDGPLLSNLRLLARKNNLEERVLFKGAQTDVVKYYAESHVFLLPSVYEPFGQTLLEAASCGVPTAAFSSNIVDTATVDILGDFGVYASDLNPKSFSKAIRIAYKQYYKTCEKDRHYLREYIFNKYSWDNLYKEITKS